MLSLRLCYCNRTADRHLCFCIEVKAGFVFYDMIKICCGGIKNKHCLLPFFIVLDLLFKHAS